MPKRNRAPQPVQDETAELRNRLEETEETLRAIRQYMVDAFVVTHANEEQVVTLSEADFPYRRMVESMNEGAVTLIPDGTIFYCNPHFAEMVQAESEKLIGVRFQDLILAEEQSAFEALFKGSGPEGARGEFCLKTSRGKCVPVQLSVYQLTAAEVRGISIIATDITERIQAEQKIRSLAAKLTMAEQEERQRISQILHDNLQQQLFAIKAQLSMLRDAGAKNNVPPEMQTSLDQVQSWLSDAIATTRSLSIDLSPVVLQGEGLAEAIRWLASQMREQYGLQVNLEAREDFHSLDHPIRVLLFQAVRELLFNVVKHAGSLQAAATLEQIDGRGRITISDTGRGFDARAIMNDPKTAHGLLMLQDRLGLIGGKIEMTSRPGDGTRAVIEIPLPGTSN